MLIATRVSVLTAFAAVSLFAQYKMESAGAPPSELAAGVGELLQKQGYKIVSDSGSAFCEIWLRADLPKGPKSAEENLTLPEIPHGTLLGAIRFPAKGADRRGQGVKPGVYTLRYSYFPQNGDHQGAAPQRDFLLVAPAAIDQDAKAAPNFEQLVDMSRKATGTPHPGVFSFWKSDGAAGLAKQGENDWVLTAKIGDQVVAFILIGKSEA